MQGSQLIHETLLSLDTLLLGCYQPPDMALVLCRATAQRLSISSFSQL